MGKLNILLLLLLFGLIQPELIPYEIYEASNTNPRPLLLRNGEILALSGGGKGYMKKYNINGEMIIGRQEIFPYLANTDSNQMYGLENTYVLVTGREEKVKIYLFDDTPTVTITQFDSLVNVAYRMNVTPLKNGSILLGWRQDETVNSGRLRIFNYVSSTKKFDHDNWKTSYYDFGTTNYYISCVEVDINNAIVCMFVIGSCQEHYEVLNSSLKKHYEYTFKDKSYYTGQGCGFDKIISLGDNKITMCFLVDDAFYCSIGQVNSDYSAPPTNPKKLMDNCYCVLDKTDCAYFSTTRFIGSCIDKKEGQAKVVVVDLNGTDIVKERIIFCSGKNVTQAYSSKFGDNFLSVFYNTGGNNVFEIMEYPFCENHDKTIFVQADYTFELKDYLEKGKGDESTEPLRLYFPELPTEGTLFFTSDQTTPVKEKTIYDLGELIYTAGDNKGTFTLKYAGVNHEDQIGKFCYLTFTVDPCFDGCKSCSEVGDETDNKCKKGCKTGYFEVSDQANQCRSTMEYYYKNTENGKTTWKPCHTNCQTCSSDFTDTEEKCDECKPNLYKLEGDTTGKCASGTQEGYYFDNNIYKKCYESCLTCKLGGTEDQNNCSLCKKDEGYYPFSDLQKQCASETTNKRENYYLTEESGTKIWKKCDSQCQKCVTSQSYCTECTTGYKKVEDKEGVCSNIAPSHYFDDGTIYSKCSEACDTCSAKESIDQTTQEVKTNCLTCLTSSGYYPLSDDSTQCSNTEPDGYYTKTDSQGNTISYSKCYETCKKCSGDGTVDNNNCLECISSAFKLDDLPTQCSKDNPGPYYKDGDTYKRCDSTCKTCVGPPSNGDSNCLTCADQYYKIEGGNNCANKAPDHYFLDETQDPKIYRKCSDQCKTCNAVEETDDFHCLDCKDGGYKKENTNNCYYTVPDGYFKDTDEIYKKCDTSCESCSGQKDFCTQCATDYKSISDKPGKCINQDSLDGYYLDNNQFKPCYKTCNACTALGRDDENLCTVCKGSNVKIHGTTNCVEKMPQYYYKDDTANEFKPCHESCETCQGDTESDCLTCRITSLYYPIHDATAPYKCYKDSQQPDGYYLDLTQQEFFPCYTTCKTCFGAGTADSNNCNECVAGAYPLEGSQNSCIKDKKENYYEIKDPNNPTQTIKYGVCYSSCKTCSEAGTDSDNKCDECPTKYQSIQSSSGKKNCIQNCDQDKYYYIDKCDTCPEHAVIIAGWLCQNCKSLGQFFIEKDGTKACVGTIEEGYYNTKDEFNTLEKCSSNCKTCEDTSDKCITCDGKILYDNKCYEKCPVVDSVQKYKLDGTCKDCPNYLFPNPDTLECQNCKDTSQYKKLDDNTKCYSEDELPEGALKSNDQYNTFTMCYQTCSTCNEVGDSTSHKCTYCKNGYFLDSNDNCISDCGHDYVSDSATRTCVNCAEKTPPQFKDYDISDSCQTAQSPSSIITNQSTNTYRNCDSNCQTCYGIPEANDKSQKCLSCANGKFLDKTGNCVSECDKVYAQIDGKCVNCKEDKNLYHFWGDNECINQPTNGFLTDPDTNTYKKCREECASCDQNLDCTSCKEGYYLQGNNECKVSCPLYLAKDPDQRKCINCKDSNKYKIETEERCRDSLPSNTYPYQEGGTDYSTNYNAYSYCYERCATCSGPMENGEHQCKTCLAPFYLENGSTNCVKDCHEKEVSYIDSQGERKCINCRTFFTGKTMYKLEGKNDQCVEMQPQTYVEDSNYNYLKSCHKNCDKCLGAPTTSDQNCETCLIGYKEIGTNNCVDNCGNQLVSDDNTRKCINCKNEAGGKYLIPGEAQCLDNVPEGKYVDNTSYNTLKDCYSNCAECQTESSDINDQKCLRCKGGFYKEPSEKTTFNCIDKCGQNLATVNSECINCKNNGQYKPIKESSCVPTKPSNSYVVDENYNTIDTCDSSCATCQKKNECTTCAAGYIPNPVNSKKCVLECDLSKRLWYLDNNQDYQCTTGTTCTADRPVLDEGTKQCVINCHPKLSESTCVSCSKSTKYEQDGKCVSTCPDGYTGNPNTFKCVENSTGTKCKTTLSTTSEKIANLETTVNAELQKYILQQSQTKVSVITGNNYTIEIFKTDECEKEASEENSLSYISFTKCQKLLAEANPPLTASDIVIAKVDVFSSSGESQVRYQGYNSGTGAKLDMSACGEKMTISYPSSNSLRVAQYLNGLGINPFNKSDPFFNDFCFPFYDENGKDVLIKDRRADFFQENTYCPQEGCSFTKVNFKTAMIECDCEVSKSVIDKANDILENLPIDGFDSVLNTNNFIVLRCYNLAFNWRYMKINIGAWLMICIFMLQWPAIINFFIIGFRPIYSYLNQFADKKELEFANPPKKHYSSSSVSSDEGTIENERTPAKFIDKKKGAKLKMLDLNKNNNLVGEKTGIREGEEKYRDSNSKLAEKDSPNLTEHDRSFDSEDLDELVFEDAKELDNRGFCHMFWRCIKLKVFFLSPFAELSALEPFCLRCTAFFLNIAFFFILNCMLYDESYVEKRYKEKGKTGFVYLVKNEIPRCIYASLACTVISFIITYFSSSKKRFKTAIDKEENPNEYLKKVKKIISSLKCQMVSFFIIDLILMCFFWYYASTFCAVYQKSQVPWVEGSLITMVFCALFQILYAFIIVVIRFSGLKCGISCIYTISKYLI